MENLLTNLAQRFSILENIPISIIETDSQNLHSITIATRNNKTTLTTYVKSEKVSQLFDLFNLSVPEILNSLLTYTKHLLIDIESITDGPLRFYLHSEAIIDNSVKDLYPFNYTIESSDPDEKKSLIGIGFIVDKDLNSVLEYKYYWDFQNEKIAKNYRFNSAGDFINLKIEQSEENISKERLATINDSINIDNFDDYVVNYTVRPEDGYNYISIMKKPKVIETFPLEELPLYIPPPDLISKPSPVLP